MKSSRRRAFIAFLLVGLLAFALGSCTIVVTSPSYIEISNISGIYVLAHVYITPHNGASWGYDLLAPSVVYPGEYVLFEVEPGNYDILVTDTTPYNASQSNVLARAGYTTVSYFDGVYLTP
jgi:hypothetical protein